MGFYSLIKTFQMQKLSVFKLRLSQCIHLNSANDLFPWLINYAIHP